MYPVFRILIKNEFLGEKWQFLRTSLTTVLTSPKTIHDFLPQMEEIADDWCHLIKQKRDQTGLIHNLDELAGRLGLEATCALVLGKCGRIISRFVINYSRNLVCEFGKKVKKTITLTLWHFSGEIITFVFMLIGIEADVLLPRPNIKLNLTLKFVRGSPTYHPV